MSSFNPAGTAVVSIQPLPGALAALRRRRRSTAAALWQGEFCPADGVHWTVDNATAMLYGVGLAAKDVVVAPGVVTFLTSNVSSAAWAALGSVPGVNASCLGQPGGCCQTSLSRNSHCLAVVDITVSRLF